MMKIRLSPRNGRPAFVIHEAEAIKNTPALCFLVYFYVGEEITSRRMAHPENSHSKLFYFQPPQLSLIQACSHLGPQL